VFNVTILGTVRMLRYGGYGVLMKLLGALLGAMSGALICTDMELRDHERGDARPARSLSFLSSHAPWDREWVGTFLISLLGTVPTTCHGVVLSCVLHPYPIAVFRLLLDWRLSTGLGCLWDNRELLANNARATGVDQDH
jgi:hypothetical protein